MMGDYRNIAKTLLLVFLSLCAIIQPGLGYASIGDEKSIEELIETYSKDNVVKVILEKRDWKVTIQKNKSFADAYGKPDLSLITPKSIIYDLKILNMSINELTNALEEQQKQQAILNEENDRATPDPTSNNKTIPLSTELYEKIRVTREQYNNATSHSERRRLKKELSILQSAYNQAKNNEKSKLRVYYSDKKKNRNYKYNSSSCQRAKSKLQEITDPAFRQKVFFCRDRQYRKENPNSCDGYKYAKQYDLKEYKKEVIRLRDQASTSCKS